MPSKVTEILQKLYKEFTWIYCISNKRGWQSDSPTFFVKCFVLNVSSECSLGSWVWRVDRRVLLDRFCMAPAQRFSHNRTLPDWHAKQGAVEGHPTCKAMPMYIYDHLCRWLYVSLAPKVLLVRMRFLANIPRSSPALFIVDFSHTLSQNL